MERKPKIGLPEGTVVPNHVAMILDGNRRWARARGLHPWEGHRAGYEALKKVARASRVLGVHTFTVWAWSTENWDRPKQEIDEIMNLFRRALLEMEKELHEEKVRLVHLGRKDRLPGDVAAELSRIEAETAGYGQNNVFNIAVDYGGRDELIRAAKRMVEAKLPADQLDEETFARFLDTADQPYPYVDLFIRTSGEQRTSGLLPWQMTYAEFFWEQDHLPDFSVDKLVEAIKDFSRRRRRFGGNDVVEHLAFKPRVMAQMEMDWRRALGGRDDGRLRDLVIVYLKEQYGLSKELAKSAGLNMVRALRSGQRKDWASAKRALMGLYEVVKHNVGLAFEPEIVANFEVELWRGKQNEEGMQQLLAEKYRLSSFQASKSARLAVLASGEVDKKNWDKAKWYMERYYEALKERVA